MAVLSDTDIQGFRDLLADLGFPDTYELIVRGAATSDGAGGTVNGTDTAIESGACRLIPGATRPEERAIADRAGSQLPLVVRLPYETAATSRHTLVVNGTRTLAIIGVLKGGKFGMAAEAVCEERT